MFGWMRSQDSQLSIASGDGRDLGFGTVAASGSHERLLNRNGTFNTKRTGLGPFASLHLYDALLTMPWHRFLLLVAVVYLATNGLFAAAYVALGPDAIGGADEGSPPFLRAFFFSVHTLSTIGYGHLVPRTLAANALMAAQSLAGLLGIAITTGLVFARFSRPTAKILFSERAVVAPYGGDGGWGFMFRIANQRSTQIIELEAQVVFSRMVDQDGRRMRRFYQLPLERSKVAFFPLAWTIVHPIDAASPLHNVTPPECASSDAEVLILLKGTDETFSETVHARSSYKAEEILWDRRFTDIFFRSERGGISGIDLGRLSEVEGVS
jgi:inward rectifier potassium channel